MPMLLITCPRTGAAVPTGLDLDTQGFIWATLRGQRLACDGCGGTHDWEKGDAYFPGQQLKPAPRRLGLFGSRWR